MNTFQNRIFNFNGGPAMLPTEVMETAQAEFLNYRGSGMSVMELSHREPLFTEIIEDAEFLLRKLLGVPPNYRIAFFPGGATFQFSAIPLNLLKEGESADFCITGIWTKKAYEEALKYNPVRCIHDEKESGYKRVPKITDVMISPEAKYLHITSNNTIYGTQYLELPKIRRVPLIADMTSEILSRKIRVEDFGVIFAGAQKNIGPSGLCVLIIREDLVQKEKQKVPILMDFEVITKNASLYNTPPTYSIYIAKLVFQWLEKMGGLEVVEKTNREKANLLYDYLDQSSLFYAPVEKESRSVMNAVFLLRQEGLEDKFLEGAEERGLHGLNGHRSVGGFRASIYNAMPLSGVEALLDYMKDFEKKA